ncbi:MAG: hypothetical protein JXD21_05665 [Candidatus Omnitrophica bacterium]|nr:hypothetical protein [Candidatus Omnitrophota bacterium]
MENKILIVHASCGRGHEHAAKALAEEFGCDCHDILDFAPGIFKMVYCRGYRFLVKHCHWVWILIFEISKCDLLNRVTHFFNTLIFRKFLAYVRREKPAIVISTHFFSSSLISDIKDEIACKNVVLVTDLGVHPVWVNRNVDQYYVGLECTAEDLLAQGIPPEKIKVTGLPLREGFYAESVEKDIYEILDLTRDKPCILFLATDLRRMTYLPGVLKKLDPDFHLVVSYGGNLKLKERLEQLNLANLKLFSFSDCIWVLMRGAEMIVTKPGGLTVFESFQLRKPLVFTHFIWGQERSNMDVACARGVGFYARCAHELIEKVYFVHNNLTAITQKMFPVSNARSLIREYTDQLFSSTTI